MPARTATRTLRRPLTALAEFTSVEALSGIVLLAATIAALCWANLALASYTGFWDSQLTLGFGSFAIEETLQHWVNDALMVVFFFVVGLEIKRELVCGELRTPRTAALPVLAALGGMAVPAAIYAAINAGSPGIDGWGIPMATDIAFALAVLVALGSRIPSGLKLFLLTLAIVDDIGAILVIALFYTDTLAPAWLLGAVGAAACMIVMRRLVATPVAYVVPAAVLWICVLESGVHATLAGVVLGLLTPAGPIRGRNVIEELEHVLHPWSSLLVVPLFALANAGIVITASSLRDATTSTIALGVVAGLVIGKPLGIALTTGLGLKFGLGTLPEGMRPVQMVGAGALAGIGFTVSLFVAGLAFEGAALDEAKLGVLVASVVSACIGVVLLLVLVRRGVRSRP
jgi:NhaA family Na+:H+ antiporter